MISDRFPYLPLVLDLGSRSESVEAFIDTGFDGDLALPTDLLQGGRPVANFNCVFADGSEVKTPVYRGRVRVGGLGVFRVEIIEIGDEPVIGRGVTDRFTLILDHGRQVRVQP
ncbi:MAG: hypothetical protein GEU73_03700 [Chloroflexi bacterium]|nr:hypothetical protein [Chloroflexota bacterium]